MSALTAPANILLTGATGFVGNHILRRLIETSFSVKAAVRSDSKAKFLTSFFQSYVDSGKLTFVNVPDITAPGAFDEAVKGVDGVIHGASPLESNDPQADPQELVQPAVHGTVGILDSALKNGSGIKRIVITSSIVTLYEPHEPGHIYSDADWFNTGPKLIAQHGRNTPSFVKYMASKVLAEQAAWKWVEDNKPSFQVVTTMPSWVFGKSETLSPEHFRKESSNNTLLRGLVGVKSGELQEKDYLTITNFTDVVDVAEGHLKALTVPEAAGRRLLLLGASVSWQDVFDILNANPVPGVTVPVGTPGNGKNAVPTHIFDHETPAKVLGLTYRPAEQTIRETLLQAVELGWKQ
ncbi:hypothetical protein M408DRAFT_241598 [Serendipita vermifera MAFF 305830]|uniref:NAD-dependent epimerase/dehydratase domain-containing protein n=1 Tax=Serendipita vermifera MAFF 305830 TaxID=933852 RepID=A0A0C2X120_SERVB|nr:hypothetical protein M408DRAFT_241598 [Serendipita vermifera MAFF 305830]